MRVVLYEWCCSGGLHGQDVPQPEALALTIEGCAMLDALLCDAAKDTSIELTVLADASRPLNQAAAARLLSVPLGAEVDVLMHESALADWTIIIAPETAGILESRVAAARAAGGRVASPGTTFLAAAADKPATLCALAAAGVAVPAGRTLGAGEPLPIGFYLPAVRKARASAGGDGLAIVRSHGQTSPAHQEQRLEAFVAGTPVGVSCLCGPGGAYLLPPVQQRFSSGDTPEYLGGSLLLDKAMCHRAERLARRAIDALQHAANGNRRGPAEERAAALGWVGVDMILGDREDGCGDRVLEVNPRLTTSFVGLRHLFRSSLMRAILDVASGQFPILTPAEVDDGRSIDFEKSGDARVIHG